MRVVREVVAKYSSGFKHRKEETMEMDFATGVGNFRQLVVHQFQTAQVKEYGDEIRRREPANFATYTFIDLVMQISSSMG